MVPPENPVAFADAVVKMMGMRGKLKTMGQNARKLAETEFSRDMLGKKFVETLEMVKNASTDMNN